MSKLTELLAELDKRRTEFDIGERASFSVNASEYDLLRPALRERDGMALVPRDAWEGFVSLVNVRLGKPTNRDKTPEQLIAMARAMLAAAEGK